MSAPPYMKLYPADYHADTTHLTAIEHGVYLLLLMAMWRANGKLPRDEAKLNRIAKCTADEWAAMRDTILEFFTVTGGLLKHRRVTKELANYQRVIDGSKKAGKASAAKRAMKNKGKDGADVGVNVERFTNQPEPEPESKDKGSQESLSLTRRECADERAGGSSPLSLVPVDDERGWLMDASKADAELLLAKRSDPDHASELSEFIAYAKTRAMELRFERLRSERAA